MKVRRSSWHYRLYRYVHNTSKGPAYANPWTKRVRTDPTDLPSSLCPYAWSIFLGLVGCLVLAILVVAFSWLIALVYAAAFVYHLVDDGLTARRLRKMKPDKAKREPEPPKEKKPSIVAEYVKAKKERVCPTIELVD
jgi:hypothetical protein